MSNTVNNFYVTVNGDLEEVHELLVEVTRLEDERDNALLERDEAVTKASDLAQELSDSQGWVKHLTAQRQADWEKLKSWNNLTREKHEEVVKLQKKEKALHGLLDQKDGHIQDLVAEYEKSIAALKSGPSEDWEGLYYDIKRERDKIYDEMMVRGDAVQRQGKQIDELRKECANKRLQIKGLQTELDEVGATDYRELREALEKAERKAVEIFDEGCKSKAKAIRLQEELDATKESGRYFADRTLTLTQQVEDLQAELIEEKNIGAALERQLEISRQSALYWCDKYQSTTS